MIFIEISALESPSLDARLPLAAAASSCCWLDVWRNEEEVGEMGDGGRDMPFSGPHEAARTPGSRVLRLARGGVGVSRDGSGAIGKYIKCLGNLSSINTNTC